MRLVIAFVTVTYARVTQDAPRSLRLACTVLLLALSRDTPTQLHSFVCTSTYLRFYTLGLQESMGSHCEGIGVGAALARLCRMFSSEFNC